MPRLGAAAVSAQDFDAVRIESRALGHGLHMLVGRGGKLIDLSSGGSPDGLIAAAGRILAGS